MKPKKEIMKHKVNTTSGNKKLYNRIRLNIIRKRRRKALERMRLENEFISNAPIDKLKTNINRYVSKCRMGYYSMLDI